VLLSFYALRQLGGLASALQSQLTLPLLLLGGLLCMYFWLLGELRVPATKRFLTPEAAGGQAPTHLGASA